MDWLDDEAIEIFLSGSFGRVEIVEVRSTYGVNQTWMVLSKDRRYLGTISKSGSGYYVFTPSKPDGTRVSSVEDALILIELPATAGWVEDGHRRYLRQGVRD